jgi:hypothetical protein
MEPIEQFPATFVPASVCFDQDDPEPVQGEK